MAINIGKNSSGNVTYDNPPVDRVLFPNITEYATPEAIEAFVNAWLDDHPEATTTVEDGSILPVKLDSSNSATDGYVLSYNATAGKFEWYDVGGELDDINSDITELKQDLTNYESRTTQIESGTYNDADGVTKYGALARVRNANIIPIFNIASITITSGYSAWIYRFDASKTLIGQGSWKTGKVNVSDLGANTAFINFTIKDSQDASADLTGKVSEIQNGFKIVYESDEEVYEYVDALKDKLYTQVNRETFAYIGSGGNFVFKDDNIFDGAGRCAWKANNNIVVKLPNVTSLKVFSIDNVVSALTNDDLYDDGSTTWIYLRAGYALVYNDASGTIESVVINSNTPIADKSYPLLMMWSSQAVGGLLYDKFLSDIQTVKINQAISGDRASSIATELNNSRHIAGDVATPLTLLHFSDPHADTNAINRILTEAGNYSSSIDGMICTGDMVANTAGQIVSWWNSSVMTCIGNHDTASYSESNGYDWTALSMADRDAYYIAPFEDDWGITHTSGTSYYYKDYATQKVRLIVMDAMLYIDNGAEATAQTSWLASLLSDAITNNLHVLIAIHSAHGGATPIECSFTRYNQEVMPTYSDCNTPQTVIGAVATAITSGLKFIGYIVGHKHQDNMWDAENDGKQLMYCITCAAVSQEAQWVDSDQNRSITEDAYNLVTIDTTHTLVKIVRGGGADIDDHMRPRKAICFDYSTGDIVGEVL